MSPPGSQDTDIPWFVAYRLPETWPGPETDTGDLIAGVVIAPGPKQALDIAIKSDLNPVAAVTEPDIQIAVPLFTVESALYHAPTILEQVRRSYGNSKGGTMFSAWVVFSSTPARENNARCVVAPDPALDLADHLPAGDIAVHVDVVAAAVLSWRGTMINGGPVRYTSGDRRRLESDDRTPSKPTIH